MSESELVETVRQAWAEVLDTQTVPLDVDFFEAGGDSVLLIVLLEQLNELTERTLEPPDLFRHSTVLAQAELLTGEPEPVPVAVPEQASDRTALLERAQLERTQRGSADG